MTSSAGTKERLQFTVYCPFGIINLYTVSNRSLPEPYSFLQVAATHSRGSLQSVPNSATPVNRRHGIWFGYFQTIDTAVPCASNYDTSQSLI